MAEGAGFAMVGWAQIVIAVLLLAALSRGMLRVGGGAGRGARACFGPGAGAHCIGGFGGSGTFDPSRVQVLIYDGTSPTSGIVGLMYTGGAATAPEGFAGPNDHRHRHSGVCLKGADVLFPVDAEVTAEQCSAAGGSYMATTTWTTQVRDADRVVLPIARCHPRTRNYLSGLLASPRQP